jgi:phosphoglycolate phosphatase-like HAD superfamily hydrolase
MKFTTMSRMFLDQFSHLIFDFDGVVLDSNGVKEKAFQKLFENYGASAKSFVSDYHRENLGVARDIKIRFILKSFNKVDPSKDQVESYCKRFEEITRAKLVDPKYLMSDVIDFIKSKHKRKEMFIASAATDADVKYLCMAHGIFDYFKDVQGSPKKKATIISEYVSGRSREQFVMIGDSKHDLEAARINKIRFVGYNNPSLLAVSDYLTSLSDESCFVTNA